MKFAAKIPSPNMSLKSGIHSIVDIIGYGSNSSRHKTRAPLSSIWMGAVQIHSPSALGDRIGALLYRSFRSKASKASAPWSLG